MRSESGTLNDVPPNRFHGNAENSFAPPGATAAGGGGIPGGGGGGGEGGHGSDRINRFVDAAIRFPPLGIDIPTPAGGKFLRGDEGVFGGCIGHNMLSEIVECPMVVF